MKASVQEGYGLPHAIKLRDVDLPCIGDGEVLVKVHAASVNALDCHFARGMPYLLRFGGLQTPRGSIRGVDLAGRVEAVGKNVVDFKAGDDVFGGSKGSFAEYAATTPDRLVIKPTGFSYEQAAALHVAGITALQGLRDTGRVQRGQHVLINGAGGGVGTFAVQIAKWLGAHVTAVTRTENVDMVRSIGADEMIDYQKEDFAERGRKYDTLFDIGGNRRLIECRRVLTPQGTLVVVGGPAGRWLAPMTRILQALVLSPLVSQRLVPCLSKNSAADLALLKELAEDGRIRPVIDRRYPLREAAAALAYVATGQARGKVIIDIQ